MPAVSFSSCCRQVARDVPWQMREPVSCLFLRHRRECSWLYAKPSGLMVGMTVNVKDLSRAASCESGLEVAVRRRLWNQ